MKFGDLEAPTWAQTAEPSVLSATTYGPDLYAKMVEGAPEGTRVLRNKLFGVELPSVLEDGESGPPVPLVSIFAPVLGDQASGADVFDPAAEEEGGDLGGPGMWAQLVDEEKKPVMHIDRYTRSYLKDGDFEFFGNRYAGHVGYIGVVVRRPEALDEQIAARAAAQVDRLAKQAGRGLGDIFLSQLSLGSDTPAEGDGAPPGAGEDSAPASPA